MDTLLAAFRDEDQIWIAIGAIASTSAVVVALIIALSNIWLSRRSARRRANNVLPAIGDELLWIVDIAEKCIQAARICLTRMKLQQFNGITILELGNEIRVFDVFTRVEFPVFIANSVVLHGADDEMVEAITLSYGALYRAKLEFSQIAQDTQPCTAPSAEDFKRYDAAACSALAAARRAYRYIAVIVNLRIPREWEPGLHVQQIEEPSIWKRIRERVINQVLRREPAS